jgi:LacI family transcriptional regulator
LPAKKKISIHDLAKQLQVSSATVSFVLNGKAAEKRISPAMEEKILKHAQKSGYRPNRVAKSLRTGKSKIIGMLVEGISDPFFSSIARIIEERAHQHDYKIFYSSTNNDTAIARELIRTYRDTQVDGYIIAPPPGLEEDIKALMEDGFPVVLFDRYYPGLTTHNIVVNNFEGAYNAVLHFVENGYRDIVLVTLHSAQVQMEDRLKGYEAAMVKNWREPRVLKIPYNLKPEQITEEVTSFLTRPNRPDAVLFATNYLCVSGLRAIADLRLRIPEHIAVIGFDDNSHFALFSPAVTAVAQPVEDISREVVNTLIGCLADKEKMKHKITTVLPTSLIVRESSLDRKEGFTARRIY